MKAACRMLGLLVCLGATVSPVQADPNCCPPWACCGNGDPCCICCHPCAPNNWCFAPDMCNPGFQVMNQYGAVYGPCHYVKPCFDPFNGILPGAPMPRLPHHAGGGHYSGGPSVGGNAFGGGAGPIWSPSHGGWASKPPGWGIGPAHPAFPQTPGSPAIPGSPSYPGMPGMAGPAGGPPGQAGPGGGQGGAAPKYGTHPCVRSPRDFFMMD